MGSVHVVPTKYCLRKKVWSRCVAAILLVPGLPMIAGLVALVRLTSRGPGIYRQQRVGLNGRIFTMYKIRTMIYDAEALTGPTWAKDEDPRVTGVGSFLRKLHLDELPQLINVLRGDMVLIGPRPERPEIIKRLEERIPKYGQRHSVLPGITGLAQVNLPPDTNVAAVQRKLSLDFEYIETSTFMLDLRLFLYSVSRLLRLPAGTMIDLFRLRRRKPEISPVPADFSMRSHETTSARF